MNFIVNSDPGHDPDPDPKKKNLKKVYVTKLNFMSIINI